MIGLWNEARQDEDVILCVQPFKKDAINMEQLKKQVKSVCGSDAEPDRYLIMKEIPVAGRQNKVDKQALAKHCAEILA